MAACDRLGNRSPAGPPAGPKDDNLAHAADGSRRGGSYRNDTGYRGGMRRPLDPDMFAGCAPVAPPIRIGDKWTAKIITCLLDGPRRFSELRVPLRGITPKVLTETLRAMERDGYLTRKAYDEIPPRVEYELTPLGQSLRAPMEVCCEWTRAHLAELIDARQSYTAAP
jgi:DNA-binding HxlR family transcriptional regulator